MLNKLNVTKNQHFIFDLTDENSQNSLKRAFPGIDSLIIPESGKYLVVTTIVENTDCLLMLFPETTDGNLSIKVFNTKTMKSEDLTYNQGGHDSESIKLTIDNLNDFANMEEITNRFNNFVFNPGGDDSPDEVKNIGSFDISNGEPVEVNNTTTDKEDNEMAFKPINEEEESTKWVEIPNTNAGGVTVTEDGEENANTADDPFAGMEGDAGATGDTQANADAGASTDTTDANANSDAQATDGGDATATTDNADASTTATIDDPKAKMRDLLTYYTNYMTELVKDPNTSTDLISATQDMIDSLIKNMESADAIEEVKSDAEEAAKEDVSATTDDTVVDSTASQVNENVDSTASQVTENVDSTASQVADESAELNNKIDSEIDALHADDAMDIQPTTSDNILTPIEADKKMLDDVDTSTMMPTPDEELMNTAPDMNSPAPTSDVDVLDDTENLTPDEEVSLLGPSDDAMVGPDGLPLDTFTGDVDALASVPAAKKISWSTDYALNGVATSDDNTMVVPEVLNELIGYYGSVANEISKIPGKEDVAMKLQKIQILSQTIANEWNGIIGDIGDACASSYDRSNMGDLEKDELDSIDAMSAVTADVMADDEQEEENELAIQKEIAGFCESLEHLM